MVDQSSPVTPSEQQAVPVAQEDIDLVFRLSKLTKADGISAAHQVVARHRLASLPCKSGEGAGGMKPWFGGDVAPADWDGTGAAVMVDNSDMHVSVGVPPKEMPWKQTVGWKVIVAYTPAPDATQTREAEFTVPQWESATDALAAAMEAEDVCASDLVRIVVEALGLPPLSPETLLQHMIETRA